MDVSIGLDTNKPAGEVLEAVTELVTGGGTNQLTEAVDVGLDGSLPSVDRSRSQADRTDSPHGTQTVAATSTETSTKSSLFGKLAVATAGLVSTAIISHAAKELIAPLMADPTVASIALGAAVTFVVGKAVYDWYHRDASETDQPETTVVADNSMELREARLPSAGFLNHAVA